VHSHRFTSSQKPRVETRSAIATQPSITKGAPIATTPPMLPTPFSVLPLVRARYGQKLIVEHDAACRRVMFRHRGSRVVERDFLGHPADELGEGALETVKPALLPLVVERPDVKPARVAECVRTEPADEAYPADAVGPSVRCFLFDDLVNDSRCYHRAFE
jgi:hypothetical protein